ncbi:hypothetical protein V8G58_07370 [Gaetbulibacter aestuarii]|uniref:Uncharacterized protein n=1 Tax=Gaetbulibacter aestuarii TaxID=1502358 RepID=A0ABW7N185_9FLAO
MEKNITLNFVLGRKKAPSKSALRSIADLMNGAQPPKLFLLLENPLELYG